MTIAYDVPPAAPLGNHCDNNDRTCFPHGRVGQSEDDRGSGRLAWYRVAAGGHVNGEYVVAYFNTRVDAGGFFGNGLRERIEAITATLHPGLEPLDWQPLSSPPIG